MQERPSSFINDFKTYIQQFYLVNNARERPSSFINGFNTYAELKDFIHTYNKRLLDKHESRNFRYANGTHNQTTFSNSSSKYGARVNRKTKI